MTRTTVALIHAAIGEDYKLAEVGDLRWSDRGRLAAIQTETGIYHGFIGSVIFHTHGDVAVSFYRGSVTANVTVGAGFPIALHDTERDPDRGSKDDREAWWAEG